MPHVNRIDVPFEVSAAAAATALWSGLETSHELSDAFRDEVGLQPSS